MKSKSQRHRKLPRFPRFILLLLLALLCIAGSELAATHRYDPALYDRLTAPVRESAAELDDSLSQQTGETVRSAQAAREAAQRAVEEAARAAEEASDEAADQFATDPSLTEGTLSADPSDTELKSTDEQEVLTGGNLEIVYFNQGDPAWASQLYGTDAIGSYGCGPTVMAMAVASITGEAVDPVSIAQLAVQDGCWVPHSGSAHTIVSSIAADYGIQATSFTGRTPEDLYDALMSGDLLVALMGPGHFTQRGHFILLRGLTLSGKVLVADPNSRERSLTLWDPETILEELSSSTSAGGPLWRLTVS